MGPAIAQGTGIGFAIDDRKSRCAEGHRLGRRLSDGPVSPSGLVTIKRMEVVHDQGHAIVNPEAAERQIRGMMAWSLGPVSNWEISYHSGTGSQSRLIWIVTPPSA